LVERDRDVRIVSWWMLIEALRWTVLVEVLGVGVQECSGMLFVVDQEVVGALPADGADEPCDVAVRARCPRWNPDDLDALGGEDSVE
jgi:hypothetical protein